MAKKIKDTDYLVISARIKAMETGLLTRERMEQVLEARSNEEAVKILQECGYPALDPADPAAMDAALSAAREETLKDLAKLYFLHEKYLGRLFRQQIGRSFHQYLLETRLSKAAELLKTTRKTATDVAFECGFNSAAYFNRSFAAAYGAPPSQYRKQMEQRKRQGL